MFLVILLCCLLPISFSLLPHKSFTLQSSLLAKRKSKNDDTPKGFKPVVQLPNLNVTATPINASLIGMDLVPSNVPETSELTDADSVFKKYQISEGQSLGKSKKVARKEYSESAPFGQETIANMSFETQSKVEGFLLTAVFVTLGFVILCGKHVHPLLISYYSWPCVH